MGHAALINKEKKRPATGCSTKDDDDGDGDHGFKICVQAWIA